MSEDRKKWLGLGKDSECRCLEFHTDLNQLCDTCPLKTIIPEGIQTQIVAQAEDNRELMPPEQYAGWIKSETEAAAEKRGEMRRNAMNPANYHPNVLTEIFIWNKERAKALLAMLDKEQVKALKATFLSEKLEAEATQLIEEAEDKAARLFDEWRNIKRHTLAENNPEVLAQSRRRYIEHHERTFIPFLDFEGQTRLQLLQHLKAMLQDIKLGFDKNPPEHYRNRLAHRMKNAQIITYLGGLIKEPEPRKAEPERLPEFKELTGPITQALKQLQLLSDTGRYIGKKGQIKTLFNALERKGYLVGNRSTTEQFSKYFQTTFGGKVTGRALRDPLTTDQEEDLPQYKAALPKKISSQSSHGKHGKHGKP